MPRQHAGHSFIPEAQAIDGESFTIYVEKVLLPTLKPGDIVIMDNLGSHKGQAVRALIRSVRAKLFFLPKYSLDLNPIEQVFAKLKHLLGKPPREPSTPFGTLAFWIF